MQLLLLVVRAAASLSADDELVGVGVDGWLLVRPIKVSVCM